MNREPNAMKISSLPFAAGKAFTLSEMLVAVGAVAVISVGLAAVFQTVGRTVTTGKRLSALTQQAAVIETRMRQDFETMTREGFLVIRHQFTNFYTPPTSTGGPTSGSGFMREPAVLTDVERYPGDPTPRARRIDELLFFSADDFRTSRESLIPNRTATSRAARIYYGHGMRSTAMSVTDTRNQYTSNDGVRGVNQRLPDFRQTFQWDRNSSGIPQYALGVKGTSQYPSPNQYASDWTLLRHATLLVSPSTTNSSGWPAGEPRPSYVDRFANNTKLNTLAQDGVFQVAGHPAAPTVFRVLNDSIFMGAPNNDANRNFALYWPPTTGNDLVSMRRDVPRFASGVVDVATTDLSEIRMVVNGSVYDPANPSGIYFRRTTGALAFVEGPLPLVLSPAINGATPAFRPYAKSTPSGLQTVSNTAPTSLQLMQSWMTLALPTVAGTTPTSQTLENGDTVPGESCLFLGSRIRYESEYPDLRGTLDPPTPSSPGQLSSDPGVVNDSVFRAVDNRRADLLALGTSQLAPRCSEFIVEWSFGQTYPSNTVINVPDPARPTDRTAFRPQDVSHQIIWYGGTTDSQAGGGLLFHPFAQRPGVFHYNPDNQDPANAQRDNASRPLSPRFLPFDGLPNATGYLQSYPTYWPSTWLIHGIAKRVSSYTNEQSSLLSFFGYFDPSFQPNGNNPADGEPAMPWPWPKMLRVTFTLTDAADPTLEQTFQYVFNLPQEPKP